MGENVENASLNSYFPPGYVCIHNMGICMSRISTDLLFDYLKIVNHVTLIQAMDDGGY